MEKEEIVLEWLIGASVRYKIADVPLRYIRWDNKYDSVSCFTCPICGKPIATTEEGGYYPLMLECRNVDCRKMYIRTFGKPSIVNRIKFVPYCQIETVPITDEVKKLIKRF